MLDPNLASTGSGNVQTQEKDATLQNTQVSVDAEVPSIELAAKSKSKKRKRNENSPLNRTLEGEESARDKLVLTLKGIMQQINNLNKEIDEKKTKREIRNAAEELKLLSDLIDSEKMLDCLENPAEVRDIEMDTEDAISSSSDEENVCSRCKKDLIEEKDITEKIKLAVQEAQSIDSEDMTEDIQTLLQRKWPEEAFQKATMKIGNPLVDAGDADLLLVLRTNQDTSYITTKFKEKYPGLKGILEEENTQGQVQYLENIIKTKKGVQSKTRVYVTTGETMENHFKALRDLDLLLVGDSKRNIGVVAPDVKIRTQIRKLADIIMLQSEINLDIYVPKREAKNTPRENKYDTLVINSQNKSYSEMLKAIRGNINPEALGAEIKSVRKRKDDSLLIVTEKENMEKLKNEINEKQELADIKIVEKKITMLVSGMDAVTTKEEIVEALKKKLGDENEIDSITVKSLYANRSGDQNATVETTQSIAARLLVGSSIKIGWSSCKIKEKVSIIRCTNCLRFGHSARGCKAQRTTGTKCLKCSKEGHSVKDCKNPSFCLSCNKDGHRADSMSCPKYRKLVYQKEAEMSS